MAGSDDGRAASDTEDVASQRQASVPASNRASSPNSASGDNNVVDATATSAASEKAVSRSSSQQRAAASSAQPSRAASAQPVTETAEAEREEAVSTISSEQSVTASLEHQSRASSVEPVTQIADIEQQKAVSRPSSEQPSKASSVEPASETSKNELQRAQSIVSDVDNTSPAHETDVNLPTQEAPTRDLPSHSPTPTHDHADLQDAHEEAHEDNANARSADTPEQPPQDEDMQDEDMPQASDHADQDQDVTETEAPRPLNGQDHESQGDGADDNQPAQDVGDEDLDMHDALDHVQSQTGDMEENDSTAFQILPEDDPNSLFIPATFFDGAEVPDSFGPPEDADLDQLIYNYANDDDDIQVIDNGDEAEDDADLAEEDAEKIEDDYRKAKKEYEAKKKRGRNTDEDDVNNMKREQENKRRKILHEHSQTNVDVMDDGGDEGFRPVVDDQDLVMVHESDENGAGPSQPHKSRKPKADTGSEKKRGRPKKQQTGKPAAKGKKPTKRQQVERNNIGDLSTLTGSNVFAAAQTNTGRAEQPTFTSQNKDKALKELVASIPKEAQETAAIDKKQLYVASKQFGPGMCKARDGEWLVNGMISRLTHYQMLGSAFMRDREARNAKGEYLHKIQGGMQCDAMGLGKTVMSIAMIVSDRYHETVLRQKQQQEQQKQKPNKLQDIALPTGMTTLIVAPNSILQQWKEELYLHANNQYLGGVLVYSSDLDQNALSQQGVVLTTYSQVQRSYPKKDYPVELVTADAKDKWWKKYVEENKGPLHRVPWRRIILDEATCIKNYKSQSSTACAELPGKFRWALTGTPAMNSLDEFYSYLRFLQAPNCNSFRIFKKNFVEGAEGKDRLIGFLRPLMLRRTHHHKLFGSKLLDLPPPTQDTYIVPLDELHMEVYKIVKERFVEHINIISREGNAKKTYCNVLTLLLRLRQFVSHPLLIQDSIRDLLEEGDVERIRDRLDEAERRGKNSKHQVQVVQHMRRMLSNRESLPQLEAMTPIRSPQMRAHYNSQERSASSQGSGHIDLTSDKPQIAPKPEPESQSLFSGFPSSSQIDLTQDDAPDSNNVVRSEDAASQSAPAPAAPKSIGKDFGMRDDFHKFILQLKKEGKTVEIGKRVTCARCKKHPKRPVVTSCRHTYCADCQMEDTQEAMERGRPANVCKRCNSYYTGTDSYHFDMWERGQFDEQPRALDQPEAPALKKPKPQEIINQWIDKDGNMLTSAKTQAFKAQIMNWFEENPDTKIIVYTQFLTMMFILIKVCEIEGWSYLLYHGSMNTQQRNRAVKRFGTENKNIFFATLATGGVGLNLTMATKVMLIDPWWNQAVEQQAFCRTYRRGQTQRTSMMRFAAQGTVDEHILKLQERKEREITSVMGEENMKKSLPIGDLLKLFGDVGEDDEGNAFIYQDNARTRGPARAIAPDETEGMADATDQ